MFGIMELQTHVPVKFQISFNYKSDFFESPDKEVTVESV